MASPSVNPDLMEFFERRTLLKRIVRWALASDVKGGILPDSVSRVVRKIRQTVAMFLVAISLIFSSALSRAAIVINEIHYNPDVKTEPAEFVELYNTSSTAVDLSGWYFSSAIEYRIPSGTLIAPGGYLVIAQNPSFLFSKFGATALGPYTNALSKYGEKIVLRNAAGDMEDQVEYKLGFPWPTVGDPPGYSIELINPNLDNDLGGSWRVSVAGNPGQQAQTLISDHASWKYLKGTSEASSPTTAWRQLTFNDASWAVGTTPIGYGENFLTTVLSDMQANYTAVFFRKTFTLSDPTAISGLILEAQYDDGFKVWINGAPVLDANISSGEVPYNGTAGTAREDLTFNVFTLNNPASYLRVGNNVIAIQAHNSSLSASSDFFLDIRLRAQTGQSNRGPTPGRINSVYATNIPPEIRQVDHSPNQPAANQPVKISAKLTDPDRVQSVVLEYQVVNPGNYIELTDAAYTNQWTTATMNDNGAGGDEFPGDDVYTVTLPASLQTNRRLVRYRITATDTGNRSIRAPYADDPQPNFAYFVYDGAPEWRAAVRPGTTPALTFSSNVMSRLPTYILIAKRSAVEDATWFSRYGGDLYRWAGTLVYDGKVYDHIHYRARGGVWRYAMVKNMWKFDLNRGHDFEARDNWDRKFNVPWTKVNLGASIQQGDYLHRGEQGMFESVGFRLFNLAGVESPHTSFVTFRVIDDANEADPTTQFEGDFWGVYLATEQEDGRFLEEHNLPDGNLYKMESGTGELNNLGPAGPTDKSDLNYFLNTYNSTTPTDQWWRTNLDLAKYYSYQTMLQAFHHYDVCCGKNYFYYRNPVTRLWEIHTWDLDLTWADNMYVGGVTGGTEPFRSRVLSDFSSTPSRPQFTLEFKNRVRELRDLLWNTDQAYKLIDEYARLLRGTNSGPTILDADRCMWDYNPKMTDGTYSSTVSKAQQGRFYQWQNEPSVSKDFNGCIQLMKNYVTYRSSAVLDPIGADSLIPSTPTVTYAGPANYPINRLRFRSSNFSGNGGFASMKWRVGEITDTNSPSYDSTKPWKYEIEASWESAELTAFNDEITIPPAAFKVGGTYRVRVRMTDSAGRASHWSPAAQFIVGEQDNAAALIDHLNISEVMYHSPAGSEFDFVEVHNASAAFTLDLTGVKFTQGIDFTFPGNATLAPDGYLLVVKAANLNNYAAFRAYYSLDGSVPIIGAYTGDLNNDGEQLTLKTAAGGTNIVSFKYSNGRGWPLAAAGGGHSLVPLNSAEGGQGSGALEYGGNWRASTFIKGSPGQVDPAPPNDPVLLNEIVAHTDFTTEFDSNDWIELYNRGTTNVTLGANWYLSDSADNLRKWMIPSSTVVLAKGFVSFDEVTGFHNPTNIGFGLDKSGEQVFLSYVPGTTEDRVVDSVSFKAQENGWSLARYLDGGPFWYQVTPRTRNAANAAPAVHVVINEVMYHPLPRPGYPDDNVTDEFIELFNPTPGTVNLYNTNGLWRLNGGVDFYFPANTSIPAGGYLVVVNFDPTNPALLGEFLNLYGTPTGVTVVGPYGGKLGNDSDRVALEKPQAPDLLGGPISWVIVDEVIYGDQLPWPSSPDATGPSLHRLSSLQSGNDPANWFAAASTAGRSSNGGGGDTDGDGMPDTWELANRLRPNDPADASEDPDGDGLTNLQEYIAGTDPQNAQSVLRFNSVAAPTGGPVTLRFTAMEGKSYTVQYRDTLSGSDWSKLKDIDAQPSRREEEVTDASSGVTVQRFYRVVTPRIP